MGLGRRLYPDSSILEAGGRFDSVVVSVKDLSPAPPLLVAILSRADCAPCQGSTIEPIL